MFNKNRLYDSIQPLVSFNLLFFLKKKLFSQCAWKVILTSVILMD